MTPSLAGRWQTRAFLLGVVGGLISLVFGALLDDYVTPFALLFYVFLAGIAWDTLYNYLQSYRWDHDWPPLFFLFNGVIEGAVIWLIVALVKLPGVSEDLQFWQFLAHYGTVWTFTFLFMLGPMKIFFVQWRFNAGELE